MPVFPGTSQNEYTFTHKMEKGAHCNKGYLKHYTHNGSHVDAPFHFDTNGQTIDEIPIEHFVYEKPCIINKELFKSELISLELLQNYFSELTKADIVLFYTGYSKYRNKQEIFLDDFPTLSLDAAKYIREKLININAIAIDVISIESMANSPLTKNIVHRTLLEKNLYKTRPLLIYEDIDIGKVIDKKISRIYAFPLRIAGMDASPVNMVAEVE